MHSFPDLNSSACNCHLSLSQAKYDHASRHPDSVKIITPDWLLDSIELGKRLEEEDYHPSTLQYLGRGEEEEGGMSPTCNGENNNATAAEEGGEGGLLIVTSGIVQNIPVFSHGSRKTTGRGGRKKKGKKVLTPKVGEKAMGESVEGGLVSPVAVPVTPELSTPGRFTLKLEGIAAVPEQTAQTPPQPVLDADSATSGVETTISTEPTRSPTGIPPIENPTCSEEELAITSPTSPERVPAVIDRLLEGITMCFTDYQDCMDAETITKWKEVMCIRLMSLLILKCILVCNPRPG